MIEMIGREQKMRCISLVILLLLSSSALADDADKLLGNWRLVSFFTEDIQTKQRTNSYGEHPNGFIGLTPGRFYAFVTAESRNAPQTPEEQAASYRTIIAYTGKWRLDGEKFITKVDVAWNPGWVGTDQIRFWRLEGDKLFITTAPIPIPGSNGSEKMMIGNLVWERDR
jgi:Lipocalin-like domain